MRHTPRHRDSRSISLALAVELTLAVALLTGCASSLQPQRPVPPTSPTPPAPSPDRDGPEANPPPDLVLVPDAEPTLDPVREGGPNKPYAVFGQGYVPITVDTPFSQRGGASWYGRKFQGKPTASGELYNMYAMTAAHRTLPIPSYARVRNPANGREVLVRINDRGPFHSTRIIDLSYTAALKLGVLHGVTTVEVERITFDDIRTGAWRRDTAPIRNGASAASPYTSASASVDRTTSESPRSSTPQVEFAPAFVPAINDKPERLSEPEITSAPVARALTLSARGFWIQIGAFHQRSGAENLQKRVEMEVHEITPLLALFSNEGMFRLQAGPYPTRDEARRAAKRLRSALQLVPVIVERR